MTKEPSEASPVLNKWQLTVCLVCGVTGFILGHFVVIPGPVNWFGVDASSNSAVNGGMWGSVIPAVLFATNPVF